MSAVVDLPHDLYVALKDRTSNVFLQAQIYRKGRYIATIPMPLVGDGLYRGTFTPQAAGDYLVHFLVFLDAAFTTPDPLQDATSATFTVYKTSPDAILKDLLDP